MICLDSRDFKSSSPFFDVAENPGDDSQEGNLFKSLFNVKNLRDAWRSLLKKREGHKRLFIILLILAFELEIFLSQGRWSSLFLFFKKHLKWTAVDYSRYITICGVLGMLAQYVVVPVLSQRFKFHDCTISLIDAVTRYILKFIMIIMPISQFLGWKFYCVI